MKFIKSSITFVFATLFILTTAMAANAAQVTSLYGDKDGFGIGVQDGQGFDYSSIVNSGDDYGTDTWLNFSVTWAMSYDMSEISNIDSASIEIFHGGLGFVGNAQLYMDGVFIGYLTDGDDTGPEYNYACMDVFDLTAFAYLLDGTNIFSIVPASNNDVAIEGWVFDYAELTISPSSASVPVPGTMWLLLAGVYFLALAKRRLN